MDIAIIGATGACARPLAVQLLESSTPHHSAPATFVPVSCDDILDTDLAADEAEPRHAAVASTASASVGVLSEEVGA